MARDGLPLEGVRVVEYANFVAAPACGRLLADWGAEVIKIEPHEGDTMRFVGFQWNFPTAEDENAFFEIENSGKKGRVIGPALSRTIRGDVSKVGYFFDIPSSLKLSLYIVMT